MWHTPLAHLRSPRTPALVRRWLSLRPHTIQAVAQGHRLAKEKDRDLILKVMGTLPSPREARQFLQKFSLPTTAAEPSSDFVDSLLWPTNHLALIKLEGPFEKSNLTTIANTLVQLQRLGLMSIIMLDNQGWWRPKGSSSDPDPVQHPAAGTRQKMMEDMIEMVEEIEKAGGKARPVYDGLFEQVSSQETVQEPSSTSGEISVREDLLPLRSCLKLCQIPVMIPMATTSACHRIPVQSNKALVALAKYMGASAKDKLEATATSPGVMSMVPMRLIVVNTTGGIPLTRANGIQGPTHCFVNLKDEYSTILEDLDHMAQIPPSVATSYRADLDMIKESLEYLPPTCSALITSSPSLTLITNLITDKPLFSSTMRGQDPKVMLATTVLRNGLDIFTFRNSLHGLDLGRLQTLLESSFGKSLDADGFYSRIQESTKTVILAGQDYMGAAIVTREGGEESGTPGLASVAYLDKFSVAPKSQGIGVADILWKKLQDEFPDLVWRSRSDNPVNKWYFDRADGNIRIPGTNWTVFWYGPKGLSLMRDYIEICRRIPASFYPPKAS